MITEKIAQVIQIGKDYHSDQVEVMAMKKEELLEWYNSIYHEQMPIYIEADDANNSQLLVNGEWKNIVFAWALFSDGHKWKYAETDSERGYILDVKTFETEFAAVEYAKNILSKIYLSIKGNSKAEMLCRFIQKKFGYSEKRANTMVNQMAKHTDVFEEFFNYARTGRFCKKDKSQTQVHGYTAEFLSKEYNLSPLGAYNYLVYLIEDPERALADLKAGLPTRDSSKFEKFIDQEETQEKMDKKITTPAEEVALDMTTVKIAQAIQIAKDYHSDQVDKSGQPYMEHLYAVANGVKTEEEIIVALLHDMLEDARTDIKTHEEARTFIIQELGFSGSIADALWTLRHAPSESYMDYIERISKNELARKVKLSDLAHNMNEQRLEKLDEKTRCRLLKKYVPAKQFLEECK